MWVSSKESTEKNLHTRLPFAQAQNPGPVAGFDSAKRSQAATICQCAESSIIDKGPMAPCSDLSYASPKKSKKEDNPKEKVSSRREK